MPGLTLVLDLSASLYMGLVDAGGSALSSRIRPSVRGESAHGLLDELMAEAGLGPDGIAAISGIAVGTGPGSFTGIRVAIALAQGLAFARRLPLHPFSSLAAMRACAPAAPGEGPRVAAAIAANAGRYYVSAGDPAVEALRDAAALEILAADCAVLVTSGPVPDRARLAAAFARLVPLEESMDFAAVARLALAGPAARDGVVKPNYLMASAAEEKRLSAGGPA